MLVGPPLGKHLVKAGSGFLAPYAGSAPRQCRGAMPSRPWLSARSSRLYRRTVHVPRRARASLIARDRESSRAAPPRGMHRGKVDREAGRRVWTWTAWTPARGGQPAPGLSRARTRRPRARPRRDACLCLESRDSVVASGVPTLPVRALRTPESRLSVGCVLLPRRDMEHSC